MLMAPVWQGSDAELLAELQALETRLHATWAQMLSVVAEIETRGTAATMGYGTDGGTGTSGGAGAPE